MSIAELTESKLEKKSVNNIIEAHTTGYQNMDYER